MPQHNTLKLLCCDSVWGKGGRCVPPYKIHEKVLEMHLRMDKSCQPTEQEIWEKVGRKRDVRGAQNYYTTSLRAKLAVYPLSTAQ